MKKTIILTGGGTAGHVMPNIALLPNLRKSFDKIYYIGAANSIEKAIAEKHGIEFFEIPVCKLQRKLTFKNLAIPFRLLKSIKACKSLINKLQPDIIFSKGGFVGLPVCLAAKKLSVPYIIHESDYTMGLANKLCAKKAQKILTSFDDAVKANDTRYIAAGSCIRNELFGYDKQNELKSLGFSDKYPTVLVMGGSLGSVAINNALKNGLVVLLKNYNIIHISGSEMPLVNHPRYINFKFTDKIGALFAASDIIAARAGSNSIFEFLALNKPMLLIPLSKKVSRGDQILNAEYFEKKGFAKVLKEEDLNKDTLINMLEATLNEKNILIQNMQKYKNVNGTNTVTKEILKTYIINTTKVAKSVK